MMDAPAPATVAESGVDEPAMWITREAASMRAERAHTGGWEEPELTLHQESTTAAVARSPKAWRVDVNALRHLDFTGAPYGSSAVRALASGPLGGTRAHQILNTISRAFFDHALRAPPTPQYA